MFLVVSCRSVESNNDITVDKLEKLAQSKFGENFSVVYNKQKDFALCISLTKSKIPNDKSLNYFIYNIENNSIFEERNIGTGSVSWYSDYEIKVIEIPGTIRKNQNQENGYIINLKTNSKTKLNGGVN